MKCGTLSCFPCPPLWHPGLLALPPPVAPWVACPAPPCGTLGCFPCPPLWHPGLLALPPPVAACGQRTYPLDTPHSPAVSHPQVASAPTPLVPLTHLLCPTPRWPARLSPWCPSLTCCAPPPGGQRAYPLGATHSPAVPHPRWPAHPPPWCHSLTCCAPPPGGQRAHCPAPVPAQGRGGGVCWARQLDHHRTHRERQDPHLCGAGQVRQRQLVVGGGWPGARAVDSWLVVGGGWS